MTALVWDEVGSRVFHTGVDRGVLYIPNSPGVVWNGIVSVDETPNREVKPFYVDGVKYLETHILGDYQGKLTAFTYPEEFDMANGIRTDGNGLFLYDQPPISFGLSYRTLIGDDILGTDLGYRIHLLYNLMANPEASTYTSLGGQVTPVQFAWALSGTPEVTPGYRPTAHVMLDSTRIEPLVMDVILATLYGTATNDAELPPLSELLALLEAQSFIVITDNGDGTWSADGPPHVVQMLDASTFQISQVNASYLDADTYEIYTTNLYPDDGPGGTGFGPGTVTPQSATTRAEFDLGYNEQAGTFQDRSGGGLIATIDAGIGATAYSRGLMSAACNVGDELWMSLTGLILSDTVQGAFMRLDGWTAELDQLSPYIDVGRATGGNLWVMAGIYSDEWIGVQSDITGFVPTPGVPFDIELHLKLSDVVGEGMTEVYINGDLLFQSFGANHQTSDNPMIKTRWGAVGPSDALAHNFVVQFDKAAITTGPLTYML